MSKIYKLYRLSIADQFEILIFYTGIIKKKKKRKGNDISSSMNRNLDIHSLVSPHKSWDSWEGKKQLDPFIFRRWSTARNLDPDSNDLRDISRDERSKKKFWTLPLLVLRK
jgi:hypothetical protein